MIYQLSTGKVIEISLEQFLEMTDDDIEYLVAYNVGESINNPFFKSSFQNKVTIEVDDDITPDLLETDSVQKLSDLDLDRSMLDD
jgi:hypothetical protein